MAIQCNDSDCAVPRRLLKDYCKLTENKCIIYINDVIFFSETPQEHLKNLEVFHRFQQADRKLNPEKSHSH